MLFHWLLVHKYTPPILQFKLKSSNPYFEEYRIPSLHFTGFFKNFDSSILSF